MARYCFIHGKGWATVFYFIQFFQEILGKDWVYKAHEDFANEIRRMRAGEWSYARIIARKN